MGTVNIDSGCWAVILNWFISNKEKQMITLHSFGQGVGVIDSSPFVIKIDLFLRMAELPFNSAADIKYLKKAPKNKLPYIIDDNLIIGDSHFILVNFDNAFNRVAREYHNLMIFCQLMQAQFYKDVRERLNSICN